MKVVLLLLLGYVCGVAYSRPQRRPLGGLVQGVLDPNSPNRQHGGPLGFGLLGNRPRQPGNAQLATPQGFVPNTGNPNLIGGVLGGLGGSANAAGAGQGSVNQDRVATGTGTGIAQAGPGGFGVGLGVGGAVATPIGDFTFGQGQSVAVGK